MEGHHLEHVAFVCFLSRRPNVVDVIRNHTRALTCMRRNVFFSNVNLNVNKFVHKYCVTDRHVTRQR